MARLFARWIGRRRTLDGASLVDRPVSALAHSAVSGILKAHIVEPERFFVSEEMGDSYSWYIGAANNEPIILNQILITNVTDSATQANLLMMRTPEAASYSWENAFLVWVTTVAARSYFLWEGVCPMENNWLYGKANAADTLVFQAWGQYADFYE